MGTLFNAGLIFHTNYIAFIKIFQSCMSDFTDDFRWARG